MCFQLLKKGHASWCDEHQKIAVIFWVAFGFNELAATIEPVLTAFGAKRVNSTADRSKRHVKQLRDFGLGETRVLGNNKKEAVLREAKLRVNGGDELAGSQAITRAREGHGIG